MHASSHAVNPFGMLVDPEAVTRALEGSQRLECLNRRVCRPLDRQVPVKASGGDNEVLDALMEREDESGIDH